MKATITDLRRRLADVLRALDEGERVHLFYRGKEKGVIMPTRQVRRNAIPVKDDPAFGMWADREETKNVPQYVRTLRKRRSQ
jgi:prevent-host-death family protein